MADAPAENVLIQADTPNTFATAVSAIDSEERANFEMNDARQLYLQTYGRIDTLDSLIKKTGCYLRSWKYWHSAKNHCLSMAVVVSYDIFNEVVDEAFAEFGLTADEAKSARMEFHEYRERLSQQGLEYDPSEQKYPGDKLMRVNTKKTKNGNNNDVTKMPGSNNRPKKSSKHKMITAEQLKEAKRGLKSRLCGDLTKISAHLRSETRVSNQVCAFCGEISYTKCGICDAALHNNPSTGKCKGYNCFLDYHSDVCFGLAKSDSHLLRKRKKDWVSPDVNVRSANKNYILSLEKPKRKATDVPPTDRRTRSNNPTT